MEQIFIDTGGFKALIDDKDQYYPEAEQIWQNLKSSSGIRLLTSNFVLDESLTLLRVRCGLPFALKLRDLLVESAGILAISRVTVEDEQNAWKWFKRDWKNLSFTDCVSFALMERVGVKKVVAFDEQFEWAGFKLEKP